MSVPIQIGANHHHVDGVGDGEKGRRVGHQLTAVAVGALVELEQEALVDARLARAAERTGLEALAAEVHVDIEVGRLSLAWQGVLVATRTVHVRVHFQVLEKGLPVQQLQVQLPFAGI